MKKIEVVRNTVLAENIFAVDGFSGTGKTLMLPLIGHLENSELWQIDMGTERLVTLDYLKKIDRKAAKALIKMSFDERLYDLQLSRNVNFREFDDSSVQNNLMYEQYYKRINDKSEREDIVQRIKKEQSLYVTDIHYIFGYSDLYIKALYNQLVSYAIMMRNPAHIVKAYYNQNLQKRIITDPMELTLCIQSGKSLLPYFAADYVEDHLTANDLERTILFVYNHTLKVKKMYDSLKKKEKEKVLFIPFENLTQDYNKYVDIVCEKSNRKRSKTFKKVEKFLDLPRKKEEVNYNIVKELQKSKNLKISKKYKHMMDELIEEYKQVLKRY